MQFCGNRKESIGNRKIQKFALLQESSSLVAVLQQRKPLDLVGYFAKLRSRIGQNRKILLFADNISCHKIDETLKNIKIIFMSPNTTSFNPALGSKTSFLRRRCTIALNLREKCFNWSMMARQ